eukprot:621800-Pyramimonas_sp.AAC.1
MAKAKALSQQDAQKAEDANKKPGVGTNEATRRSLELGAEMHAQREKVDAGEMPIPATAAARLAMKRQPAVPKMRCNQAEGPIGRATPITRDRCHTLLNIVISNSLQVARLGVVANVTAVTLATTSNRVGDSGDDIGSKVWTQVKTR